MDSTEKTKDKTVGEKEKLSRIQVVEPDNSGFKRKETEKRLRGKVKDVQKLSAEEVQSRWAEQIIREAQEYAESIVATVREPLLVLGADLRVITANESFYRTFQVTPERTENRLLYDIGDRQWDIPKLQELLEKILPQNTVFNDFEMEHDFPTIGRRIMLLNARRIYREGNKTQTILLAIEDITERKRAEEALSVSEVRYRRLFEKAKDGILILDAETGMIVDVNPFLTEMLGLSHEQLMGKAIWEIGFFKDIASNKDKFLELQRQGYVRYEDLPLETADGRRIDVEFVSNVYVVNHQNVIQCNIRNITERRQAEETLKASETRYRRLFETAQDGILILDAETGMIADVNPFLIEMLGLSHEQLLGKAIWEIGFFKDVASNKANFMELQRQGYVRYEDLPLETAEGRQIEVEFVSNVYTVDHQNVIQCNIRNITERRQAEETLKASETRYRRLFETAQDGILILDAKTGQITDVNPFLIDMLGYSHQEFVGKKLWDIGVFKDRVVCKKAFWELQTKGFIRYEDLPLETKDGQHIDVEFVSNVYQINGEEVIQCNIRNITDRKRFEAIKDDFVSLVSHELRTPLTSIREAVSQTIDGILGEVTEQQREILSMALSDVDRLARLINDLLDVSKIEAGKMKMKIEVCEMVALVKKLISSFIPQAKAKGLEMEASFSKEKIGAYVDRDRITQVFSNLVGNAVKFTQKGRIHVSLLDREDAIECSISDTGPGIAKKDIAQLFDKFQQFGHKVNGEEKGTGLGLAVSKGIVELHKGRIWVESQVNAGTKFTFVLPKFTGKELISEGLKKAIKEGQSLSVLVFNIKNFQAVQKKMGEEKVGLLINDFWKLIKENLRRDEDDLGIEDLHTILTILPGTKKESAASALERMNDLLRSYLLREKIGEEVDLVCEIIACPDDGKTEKELLSRLENILATKGKVEVSGK